MQTIDPVKPQTTAELIKEAKREDKDMKIFVLYNGSKRTEAHKPDDEPFEKPQNIVCAGRSYNQMWENAQAVLGEERKNLIKRGYVFDVVTAREAAELVA